MKPSVLAVLVASATIGTWILADGRAEAAWVKGAPLNLRSGAGTQFRVVSTTLPGERVEVLEQGEQWTKIRKPEGTEGWIAAGFLDPQAPPAKRVGLLETEVEKLSLDLSRATADAESLRSEAETLGSATKSVSRNSPA